MKWRSLVLLVLMAPGCSPYVRVQMNLVEQARKGVEAATDAQGSSRQLADLSHTLQRRRVDEAFDADVRDCSPKQLNPDWVIEHRRAYAAALDSLATQRSA